MLLVFRPLLFLCPYPPASWQQVPLLAQLSLQHLLLISVWVAQELLLIFVVWVAQELLLLIKQVTHPVLPMLLLLLLWPIVSSFLIQLDLLLPFPYPLSYHLKHQLLLMLLLRFHSAALRIQGQLLL